MENFNRDKKPLPTEIKDQELIELRRKQIVDAAVDLFIKKGFHQTTVREIAKKFGLSIGTLYVYIKSKEDILYLVCDAIHNGIETELRKAVEEHGDPRNVLIAAIKGYFRAIDQIQDSLLLIYQETKSLDKEAMKYVLKREEGITRIFEEILERGVKEGVFRIERNFVKLMANNIVVLGHMWAFRRWLLKKYYTFEEYTEKQIGFILKEIT